MPDLVSAFLERMGLNAYVGGDYAAAEKWFRRLERREPDSIRVLRDLGVVLLASGDREGAERLFRREEALYGPSYHRHCAIADLAYSLGRRDEARARYEAALAEPEAVAGRAGAGRALVELRAALCADPGAWERSREAATRFAEAEAAQAAGRKDEALTAFLAAAELDPSQWPALNNAGSSLLNDKAEPGRALELLERAFALSPSATIARNVQLAREALARAASARATAAMTAPAGARRSVKDGPA